ncbi:MAG: ATP-binding protein [Pseudomonadota bacterium]
MKISRNYPLTLLFTIVGVLLVGSIFLIFTHGYFHSLEGELQEKASSQQAKTLIDEEISSNLHKLKSYFYQLIPETRRERRLLTKNLIEQELSSVRSAFTVLEHGGVFHKKLASNTSSQNDFHAPITYTPLVSEKYNLEALEIQPLLLEFEKKIATLEDLLNQRENLLIHQENNLHQERKEILRFLKITEPFFNSLTEEGDVIHLNSSAELAAIEFEGKELLHKYRIFEFSAFFIILLTTFSLCFILARKIVIINNQLHQKIQEKRDAENKISRAKQEWERTFDAVPDPIVLLDENHRILRLNRSMAALVNKPVEQCIGMYCYQLMHQTDTPPAYCPHSLLLDDHHEHKTVQYMENFSAFFEISVSPLFNGRGELFGSVHIARDISVQKEAETALQKANEALELKVDARTRELKKFIVELQTEISGRIKAEEALIQTQHQLLHAEKLSAIGKLSASIAHEFNNPLFAITNILLTIQQQESFSQENEKMLQLAIQECDRMKNFIRNLRDFKRPTTGIASPTDIYQTIDSMLLLCKKEFSDRKIRVEKDYEKTMPQVTLVADQLCQVLLNLLTNARDACVNGGTIRIATETHDVGTIAIHVADTGCGIAPEEIGNIFKPFYTTKQEMAGTGLGLAISLGIIERHGGTLSVQSQPGEGSVFSIILPLKAENWTIDGNQLIR